MSCTRSEHVHPIREARQEDVPFILYSVQRPAENVCRKLVGAENVTKYTLSVELQIVRLHEASNDTIYSILKVHILKLASRHHQQAQLLSLLVPIKTT